MATIRQQLDSIIAEVIDFQRIPGDKMTSWHERYVRLENIETVLSELQRIVGKKLNTYKNMTEEEAGKDGEEYDGLMQSIAYNKEF